MQIRLRFICLFVGMMLSGGGAIRASGLSGLGCVTNVELPDSILTELIEGFASNAKVVSEYQASLYMRGDYKVHKRNLLLRYVPGMFRFYKGVADYVTEMVGDVHYTAPDIYTMKVRGLTGTFKRNRLGMNNVLELFRMNIYSPDLLPGKLMSPFSGQAPKYYSYILDSVSVRGGDSILHVRFEPKSESVQLVSGSMSVCGHNWIVHDVVLKGRMDLVEFTVHLLMGESGGEAYLPKEFNVNLMFKFLWNKLEGNCMARMDYEAIKMNARADSSIDISSLKRSRYDLTNSYLLECDNAGMSSDTSYVWERRTLPLTDREQAIYADFYRRKNNYETETTERQRKFYDFWYNVGDAMISSHTVETPRMGKVRFSPLLDLGKVSYSHSNGFSYRMQLKYDKAFQSGRWIGLMPKVGYNFTRKEFYWSTDFDFFYSPSRLGALTVQVGNGNRIYTSRVVDEIRELEDTLVDFEKLNLEYFKDTYVRLGNRVELCNGLLLTTGVTMHWRKAMHPSELQVYDQMQRAVAIRMQPTYTSFAPHLNLKWTPGQYYYMNGRRKNYLHSHYPTFSVDYERGLKGVLGSNGEYERMEAEVQQRIPLSSMSFLFYRFGGGGFTNQETVYFADFSHFSRSNLPVGWNDEIGGVFHLLDGDWYNASQWYGRAHLTYEAPFILLPRTRKLMGLVHSERIYLSTLYTIHFHPYVEMGYGIGTYLFDLGIFVSNANGKFREIGCKFTFELFSGW